MDSKKIIEKLFKIAENQQKIINKLAQTAPVAGAGADRAMEVKLKANFQRLLPHFKVSNVRVDGMNDAHPEAHVEGEGAEAGQVKGIVTETFLLNNRVPVVYYNGQALA
jgi:hypothetical protein